MDKKSYLRKVKAGSICLEISDDVVKPVIEVHGIYKRLSDKEKFTVLKKFHSWIGEELLKIKK